MPQETDRAAEVVGNAEPKLDFSRYRTGDLTREVIELVNVPDALRRTLVNAFVAAFMLVTVNLTLIYSSDAGMLASTVIAVYGFGISLFFGLVVAILRLVNRSLASLESVLRILLDIARMAADDYRQLRSGSTRMPSASELISQVYLKVLVPVLEDAITQVFGIIATPVLWIYKATLGVAVGRLIRQLTDKTDEQGEALLQNHTEERLRELAERADEDIAVTSRAADIVGAIGRRVRTLTVVPMLLAVAAAIGFAALPLIVLSRF